MLGRGCVTVSGPQLGVTHPLPVPPVAAACLHVMSGLWSGCGGTRCVWPGLWDPQEPGPGLRPCVCRWVPWWRVSPRGAHGAGLVAEVQRSRGRSRQSQGLRVPEGEIVPEVRVK